MGEVGTELEILVVIFVQFVLAQRDSIIRRRFSGGLKCTIDRGGGSGYQRG